jgi:hypothetical protein
MKYQGKAGGSRSRLEQGAQTRNAAAEIRALAQVLLQQFLESRIDDDRLVELRVGTGSVGSDADQVARPLIARKETA